MFVDRPLRRVSKLCKCFFEKFCPCISIDWIIIYLINQIKSMY